MLVEQNNTASGGGTVTLKVYAIPSGRLLRSWATPPGDRNVWSFASYPGRDSNSTLSWTADGQRLAFSATDETGGGTTLRELSLARPGNNLAADSKVIVRIGAKEPIYCRSPRLTADGKTVLCGADLPKSPPAKVTLDATVHPAPWTGCAKPADVAYPALAEISLATGKLTVLWEVKPSCMGFGSAAIIWSSPTGRSLIGVIDYTDDPSMKVHHQGIVITAGKVTMLTGPDAAQLAPNAVAY